MKKERQKLKIAEIFYFLFRIDHIFPAAMVMSQCLPKSMSDDLLSDLITASKLTQNFTHIALSLRCTRQLKLVIAMYKAVETCHCDVQGS